MVRASSGLLCVALAVLTACDPHAQPPPVSAPAATVAQPVAATQLVPAADGVPIAWHQYGHGEPAIVLIHGWGTDSSLWREQLQPFASRYTVITLDLAGAGASGKQRQTWSLAELAQDVAAVAMKLPAARIILVADGMAGPVALEAAPIIGSRVAGIIGVETFRTIGRSSLSPAQLDQYLEPFRTDFTAAVRSYVAGTLFHPTADPAVVRSVTELMAKSEPQRAVALLTALNRFDYTAALPALKVPVIAIDSDLGGAVDEVQLHKVLPQLRLVTLAGDDSFPMLDDSQRFNATLLQAIESLAPR